MKKDFVKFIVAISVFFVLLLVCDRTVALVENELYSSQDTKINYARLNRDVADIVILGSSRASHHYVPQILTDSLGLSCVNLGEDGQGILYGYSLAHMLLEENAPRIIVYEFGSQDYKKDIGNNIDPLFVVYGKYAQVDVILENVKADMATSINVFSSYRYNTLLHKVAMDSNETSKPYKGYEPLYGSKKDGSEIKVDDSETIIDDYKISIFKQLASECKSKGVLLIGVYSPKYTLCDEFNATFPIELFTEIGVPFLDYREATFDTEHFIDNGHLNDVGAKWFSSRIATDLKKYIEVCEF